MQFDVETVIFLFNHVCIPIRRSQLDCEQSLDRGKGLRKVGTADNTGRNEIRVAHTTQNSHWSKSMCPSIKSYYAINNFQT